MSVRIKMKFLAFSLILIIVETIIYGAYLFNYFDWGEFVQVALGVLLICSVMIPIACNAARRNEKESLEGIKNLVRYDKGNGESAVCTFSINGDVRAAFSGLLFSILLGPCLSGVGRLIVTSFGKHCAQHFSDSSPLAAPC